MYIDYALLDPSKNRTILVMSPVSNADRAFVARYLLEKEPSAEQLGFVTVEGETAYLEMAGGEFCGNAVRCAGFITGKKAVVCVGQTIVCDGMTAYVPKNVKGIRHFVLDKMMDNAEEEIRKIKGEDAVGFMFLSEEDMRLRPLVYVPGIDTLFWENSCASGSVAVADYLCNKYQKEIDVVLRQPGGDLRVKTAPDSNVVCLSGQIDMVKRETICIPEQSC